MIHKLIQLNLSNLTIDISNNYEYGTVIQKFFPLFMYITVMYIIIHIMHIIMYINNLNMLNSWIYVIYPRIQHVETFFLHLLSLR